MLPLTHTIIDTALQETDITNIGAATIRQIGSLARCLERISGERFVHLQIGNPGLPPNEIGIKAEIDALRCGVAGHYPIINGIPQLKEAGSRFIKAFMNLDIDPAGIIPTVGSMQGSFTIMMLLGQRLPGKDTVLFLSPGFPAQRHQAKLLGLKEESIDIFDCRGSVLRQKLEEKLSKDNVTAMIYSNPNNPAWTNLTDEEFRIIGELATTYDVIVVEDLAYIGMDFRTDFSRPGESPFINSVANYTDNYILLISSSKIFSYAGQRIGIVCIPEKVFTRRYNRLNEIYDMPRFGDAYIFGVLYAMSSGTSHSAQFAMAAMLDAAVSGKLDFVADSREYARRCNKAKQIFIDNGFHIVYDKDVDTPISDGFFFTVGYNDLDGEELQRELLRYGIATISLPSTGSHQKGVRICVSMLSDPSLFTILSDRLKYFSHDH